MDQSIWPNAETTQELLDGVRAGETDAAGKLLERHRESLRRLVMLRLDRRIQQRMDASDIVQEVMLEANRRLATYLDNPCMPFHLWLRQMARDRIIDAHRRHRASHKRSVDREQSLAVAAAPDRSTMELAAQICDQELTPAAAATMEELYRRFVLAIDQLEESDRDVILMRHFEHLSNQEIAQALELTEPAASMRYLRAMRRLRKVLSDDALISGDGTP
ncbi:MAG: sigma-70 family RNA polymerase sigma factor [Pirellulales bacterium]